MPLVNEGCAVSFSKTVNGCVPFEIDISKQHLPAKLTQLPSHQEFKA
ncbi:hypothetical protein HDF16_001957 [Granulicella aggregans]|uniref:Uncharacterized protein n=1 Tax=Granulicella aggregans TaxID=474949 RepID=A0A7W8E367_9BACT|nr:hypothetical protein [Granulicella aggregans]